MHHHYLKCYAIAAVGMTAEAAANVAAGSHMSWFTIVCALATVGFAGLGCLFQALAHAKQIHEGTHYVRQMLAARGWRFGRSADAPPCQEPVQP